MKTSQEGSTPQLSAIRVLGLRLGASLLMLVAGIAHAEEPHSPNRSPIQHEPPAFGGSLLRSDGGSPGGVIRLDSLLPNVESTPVVVPIAQTTPAAGSSNQTLGEAPEDTRLLFLRRTAPLLEKGELAIDTGFQYRWREFKGLGTNPVPGSTELLITQRARARQIFTPLGIRYGATDELQLFAAAPVGFTNVERSNVVTDTISSGFGGGDITFGFNYLLKRQAQAGADIVGSVFSSAPTGADPFDFSPGPAALGSGFWGVGANLLFVKTIDPAVMFGGFGYGHQFDRTWNGSKIDPGEIIVYNFGTGFSVNDQMTFVGVFEGAFQHQTKSDGIAISDSMSEPFSLRFSMVYSKNANYIFEPFVRFGLNDDAPQADFGVVITWRPQRDCCCCGWLPGGNCANYNCGQ